MTSLFLLLFLVEPADDLLTKAVTLAKANRLDEAEQVLREGQKTYSKDARFPVELAGISWRRKQTGQAKSYLHRSLRLDPANDYARQFLGTAYLLDGNLDASLKYLQPVVRSVSLVPVPKLRPLLLERLPAVSTGQTLTRARLADTERNFERLRIFGEPRFELNDTALTIRAPSAVPALSGTLGRLLPFLRGLPYQQLMLDLPNLDQRAISLSALGRWDADKRRIAVSYRVPQIRYAYSLWADLRDENWLGDRHIRSARLGAQVKYELGAGKVWTPGIHLSRHNATTVWEIRNRFDLPRWRLPEHRLTIDSSVTSRTGRVLSVSPSRLWGAEADTLIRWLPQTKDDLYQVKGRLRGAALTGNLPIDALYQTAMERDNDLWLRGHVGTKNGQKGNAPMGTRYAVAQTGVSRRLLQVPFLRLDAGPFLDVGNIGGTPGLGSRGFLYDAGVQADVTVLGGFRFSVIYGRDLRDGRSVFYTAIMR